MMIKNFRRYKFIDKSGKGIKEGDKIRIKLKENDFYSSNGIEVPPVSYYDRDGEIIVIDDIELENDEKELYAIDPKDDGFFVLNKFEIERVDD